MNIISKIIPSIVAVALVASCSKMHDEPLVQQDREQEVELAIPVASTRTMIGDDGKTTNWVVGDKIALWAEKSDDAGNFVVENATFMLRHFSPTYDKAFFSAKIADLPPVDNYEMQRYNYYLCSPLPNSVNGTEVTFNLPAVQSGKYEGGYDIMVARPVEEELSLTYFGQTELNTSFMHQMHALKITVPNGKNNFGQAFTSLEITFSENVVGDITFDITDPDATPRYSNLTNKVMVTNNEGFNEGDVIWVFVLPCVMDDVSYRVHASNKQRSVEKTASLGMELKRGYVTPITMTIPELYKHTSMTFAIARNNLGEDFNSVTLKDNAGNTMGVFSRNSTNVYTWSKDGDLDVSAWRNTDFTLVFDTPHAVVETKVHVGDIVQYTDIVMPSAEVPYLMYEDFSLVNTFTDGHDTANIGLNLDGDTYIGAEMLDGYDARLAGWSASHIGVSGGNSLRIMCRYEGGASQHAYYKGRLDSAPLGKIKSSAKIKVEFNYGGNFQEYFTSGGTSGIPQMYFGWTTDTGALVADQRLQTSMEPKYLSNTVIGKTGVSTGATYTSNINRSASVQFDATPSTRLTWYVSSSVKAGFWGGNGNYWLYIDNIRVTIVP